MSRSKGKVTRNKNKSAMHSQHPGDDGMKSAGCKWRHAPADGTIPSLPGSDFGGLRAVYVW